MIRLLAAMGICTLSVAVLAAPPLESAVSPERLVEQLGSESYSEREAAVAALERSGPAVVPALEAATRDPNPEVSKRAAQILTNFNRRADANGRLNAKPVRLAYKQIPLGTAVNDLKARTGINLVLDAENIADPLRLVTCESGELPPWEAVAASCLAAGLKEVFESELPVPKQEQRSRRGYYQPPPPPPLPEAVPVKLTDGKAPTPPGSRSTAVRVIPARPLSKESRLSGHRRSAAPLRCRSDARPALANGQRRANYQGGRRRRPTRLRQHEQGSRPRTKRLHGRCGLHRRHGRRHGLPSLGWRFAQQPQQLPEPADRTRSD